MKNFINKGSMATTIPISSKTNTYYIYSFRIKISLVELKNMEIKLKSE
jgi:hypothetical protein